MFGIAVARLDQVTEEEKQRYQALYCGLCRTIKARYGQIARAALNYDMAFFVMLCNSLHEPAEDCGWAHCVSHPAKKMPYAQSIYSQYAADLTVALAYHKCLDDVADDNTVRARAGQAALAGAYAQAQAHIGPQCNAIAASMQRISQIEQRESAPPDAAAAEFGWLLGQLFAHNQGFWADDVRRFSETLGKFVYLMDAAVDYDDDAQTGSYNPFVRLGTPPADMRLILGTLANDVAYTFEKLPLVKDVHLMRSVIYSGIWQKFNLKYSKQKTEQNAECVTSDTFDNVEKGHDEDSCAAMKIE